MCVVLASVLFLLVSSVTAIADEGSSLVCSDSPSRRLIARTQACIDVELDFHELERGEYVYDRFLFEKGVLITGYSDNCYTPNIDGNKRTTWGCPRVFDSGDPYVGGTCSREETDPDLGSPHEDFGGPGEGVGGGRDAKYPNDVAQGMVLIIQTNNVYCSNDCRRGGMMRFQFPFGSGVDIYSVTSLDVDEATDHNKDVPLVETWDVEGTKSSMSFPEDGGNNSVIKVLLSKKNVREMHFTLDGSGSLSGLQYKWCKPLSFEPSWVTIILNDFDGSGQDNWWEMNNARNGNDGIDNSRSLQFPPESYVENKDYFFIKLFDTIKVSFSYTNRATADSELRVEWKQSEVPNFNQIDWEIHTEVLPITTDFDMFNLEIDVAESMKYFHLRIEYRSGENSDILTIDDLKIEGRIAVENPE